MVLSFYLHPVIEQAKFIGKTTVAPWVKLGAIPYIPAMASYG